MMYHWPNRKTNKKVKMKKKKNEWRLYLSINGDYTRKSIDIII